MQHEMSRSRSKENAVQRLKTRPPARDDKVSMRMYEQTDATANNESITGYEKAVVEVQVNGNRLPRCTNAWARAPGCRTVGRDKCRFDDISSREFRRQN